jgi:hypothetical protein
VGVYGTDWADWTSPGNTSERGDHVILELFTWPQLSGMHTETAAAAHSAYQAAIKLTNAMNPAMNGGWELSGTEYADIAKTRDIAKAVGDELSELLAEIGAEMKRRDYRDAPDGQVSGNA